jgi:hypothetical protein
MRGVPADDVAAPDCRTAPRSRLALAMLATAARDGATQALLSVHGFDASMIAGLVNHGLATITAERVRDGGKLVAIAKVQITAAGRAALAAEG